MTRPARVRPDPTPAELEVAAAFSARLHAASRRPVGPAPTEAHRLAAALREAAERLVSAGTPPAALRRAADRAERLVADLSEHAPADRYGPPPGTDSSDAGVSPWSDWSPQSGRGNPLAPPLRLRVDGGTACVLGDVTFGLAYEGPPGCVHGGHIAAAFDEVLGFAMGLRPTVAMTATLQVRYRRPTPILRPLRLESWITSVDGRKVFVAGRLLADGEVTAEAEGLFITVGAGRFADLVATRAVRD